MTKNIVGGLLVAVLATLPACATLNRSSDVPPAVETVEVKVAVPVPCKALGKLGPEPAYVDTDGALHTAVNIFEQVKLLLAGRDQRRQRLNEYTQARAACE